MLKGEKLLWWELDKIAVKFTNSNSAKSDAAENMMKFLEKPNHDECQNQYDYDRRCK
jgi:hypothetical protein